MGQNGASEPTPLWCERCEMYVPAEREPHRSADHPKLHYAGFKTRDEAENWKRSHRSYREEDDA